MAITYPLSLPALGFSSFDMREVPVVGVTESPYTGEAYVLEYDGQWWEVDVGLPPLDENDAAVWRGFFGKLNGRAGTFLMGDPTRAVPRGSAASAPGTPLVKGAGQTGNGLIIDGLPLSATNYLRAGDYVQLGTGLSSRLYRQLEDVNSNGSGEATLTLWPRIVTAPADNAAVVVSGARGLFRLSDNVQGDSARPKPTYTRSFSAKSVV